MIKRVLVTSGHYFLGSVVGKALGTVVFILLAKLLLPEGLGKVAFFTTLVDVITVFSSFGLSQWYLKHVRTESVDQTFQKVIAIRVVLLVLTLIIVTVFLLVFQPFSLLIAVSLLLILGSESFLSIGDGYFLQKAQVWRVTSKVTSKMLVTILGVGFLYFSGFNVSADSVIYLYVMSSFVTLLWFFPWKLLRKMKILNVIEVQKTAKESFPYAALIGTSFFYARADWFIVQQFLGSASLGMYSAAYRYLDAVSLVPAALTQTLFPISAKKDGVQLKQVIKITSVMTIIGLLTSCSLFVFSGPLTTGLLGLSYMPAQYLVQIFSLAVLLFFINSPLSTVVQSSSLVKNFLPYGVANTVVNIILNVLLIPRFGLPGAAFVMVVTEVTGLAINLWFVRKIYDSRDKRVLI